MALSMMTTCTGRRRTESAEKQLALPPVVRASRRLLQSLIRVLLVPTVLGGLCIGTSHVADAAHPGLNGRIAFQDYTSCSPSSCASVDIFTINSDGSGKTLVTPTVPFEFNLNPKWSPSAPKIAYEHSSNSSSSKQDIFTINSDGSGIVNVSNGPGSADFSPTWAPTGIGSPSSVTAPAV